MMELSETQKQHLSNYLNSAAERFKEIANSFEVAPMPGALEASKVLAEQFNSQYREASEFADIFMNCESVSIKGEPTYIQDETTVHKFNDVAHSTTDEIGEH